MAEPVIETLSPSLFSPHWMFEGKCQLVHTACSKDCTSCRIAGNPIIVDRFYSWYYAEDEEVETEEEILEREREYEQDLKEQIAFYTGLLDEMVAEAPAGTWTKDMVKSFGVERGLPFTDHDILYGGLKRRAAMAVTE